MDSIKKYGLAALIVLGLNGLVPGQTTDIQNEKPQSKIGYYFALGVDYALCPSPIESDNQMYYDMGARLHVLNGIQFNPWLTLSLDFQFAYTHVFENHVFENSAPYNDLGFKLGLDFRYRLLNRFRWSPVIGVAAGPSLELTFYPQQEERYQYQGDCGWGAYLSQYIGYSYRYKNNKQLLFGVSWTVDFGFNYFVGIPLLGFRFEIQL